MLGSSTGQTSDRQPHSHPEHRSTTQLCPALLPLFTHNCMIIYSSNTIVKLAHDTTIVGFILGLKTLQKGGSTSGRVVFGQQINHITNWHGHIRWSSLKSQTHLSKQDQIGSILCHCGVHQLHCRQLERFGFDNPDHTEDCEKTPPNLETVSAACTRGLGTLSSFQHSSENVNYLFKFLSLIV